MMLLPKLSATSLVEGNDAYDAPVTNSPLEELLDGNASFDGGDTWPRRLALEAGLTPPPVIPGWSTNRIAAAEDMLWQRDCKCSQHVEARRQQLHQSLQRVLVIDARFHWNGVGNSLVRWLTLLRVGLASGRATFLWLSDFPGGGKMRFDLGSYFVAYGADWQWSPANEARVRAAMSKMRVGGPTHVNYKCLRHTWACMVPSFEVGEERRRAIAVEVRHGSAARATHARMPRAATRMPYATPPEHTALRARLNREP